VSVSVNWDNDADARKFVEEYHLPFPVGRDPSNAIGSLYGMEATPTSVFISRDGKVVEKKVGSFEGDLEAEFASRIEKLLAS